MSAKKNPLLQLPNKGNIWTKAVSLAHQGFCKDKPKYKRKQIAKHFFSVLFNPIFTHYWFSLLQKSPLNLVLSYRRRLFLKPYRVYISTQWDKTRRVKVISDSYRFLQSYDNIFESFLTSEHGFELCRLELTDEVAGTLSLVDDERFRKEGEFVIVFKSQALGGVLAAVSFSIEQLSGEWVAYIGCVQGHRTHLENASKNAQKLLHGIRPKVLVVNALQEFVNNLGIKQILGVGNIIQSYKKKHAIHLAKYHKIAFNYDEFWKELGGIDTLNNWYQLPVLPAKKSLDEIKSNKRSQYRRRYALQDNISFEMKKNMLPGVLSHEV